MSDLPPFSEWETFCVIVGSSAAALTGLMFVVVALRSERRGGEDAEGAIRAFGSPTVGHFCAVLLVTTLWSIPGQTRASLALCVSAVGIAGLAVSARVVVQARRQHAYAPVVSDWIWHAAMPFLAYAALIAAGVALARRPTPALDGVAAAALFLLFVAIHNAWDSAVYIAARRE